MFDRETKSAVARIAADLEVPAAALLAVVEVESGGRASARVGGRNEPLIRFEGHYFDRLLSKADRTRARSAGLASPRAGRVRNPRSQSARWALLRRAMRIDRAAALASFSWGVGQVMGDHWKWLGYPSIDALVEDARSGVAGQVRLMARYIRKAGLAPALQARDWTTFARRYNGPAYAKNRYDVRMRQAYARYRSETFDVSLPPVADKDSVEGLRFGARGDSVRRLQRLLSEHGHLLRADGIFGLRTDRMLRDFQRANDLEETGIATAAELALLEGRPHLPVSVGDAVRRMSRGLGARITDARDWLLSFVRPIA